MLQLVHGVDTTVAPVVALTSRGLRPPQSTLIHLHPYTRHTPYPPSSYNKQQSAPRTPCALPQDHTTDLRCSVVVINLPHVVAGQGVLQAHQDRNRIEQLMLAQLRGRSWL